jgi:hypothetical protein
MGPRLHPIVLDSEQRAQMEQAVHGGAEDVDVGLGDLVARELLFGRVTRRAHGRRDVRRRGLGAADAEAVRGHAEVDNLHPTLAVHQDVGRLNIAMDNLRVSLLQVVQHREHLTGTLEHLLFGQRFAFCRIHLLLQILAIHEVLHDEVAAGLTGKVGDLGDVGVPQGG